MVKTYDLFLSLLQVTSSKDQVNYRPLTDKPEDEAEKLRELIKKNEEQPETEESVAKLGQGFKAFLPQSNSPLPNSSNTAKDSQDGIYTYRGETQTFALSSLKDKLNNSQLKWKCNFLARIINWCQSATFLPVAVAQV